MKCALCDNKHTTTYFLPYAMAQLRTYIEQLSTRPPPTGNHAHPHCVQRLRATLLKSAKRRSITLKEPT